MACSKYEYTKKYELPHALIPLHTFPIVRVDGHAFSRFTALAQFKKPLDSRGLELANAVAMQIMDRFPGEIVMAFGQSDEYSFVWRRETTVWGRR